MRLLNSEIFFVVLLLPLQEASPRYRYSSQKRAFMLVPLKHSLAGDWG